MNLTEDDGLLREGAPGHEGPVMTAHRARLVGCRGCGRVWPEHETVCQRCGSALVLPDRRGLAAVWAWLAAGLIFYIPANMFPMLITSTLGGLRGKSESTILGGVIELLHYKSYGVAAIVFIASIVVPISKFVAIIWLARVAGRPATVRDAHRRLHVYEVVEFIGRWSMIDVFVVAILAGLIRLDNLMTIYPGPAAIAFAGVVLITMVAAMSFDSRLIWDLQQGERERE